MLVKQKVKCENMLEDKKLKGHWGTAQPRLRLRARRSLTLVVWAAGPPGVPSAHQGCSLGPGFGYGVWISELFRLTAPTSHSLLPYTYWGFCLKRTHTQLILRCADSDPSRHQLSCLNPKVVGRVLKGGHAAVSAL